MMRSAFLKPSSTLPNTHSSVALPIGIWFGPALAKSSSVHFQTAICGGAGAPAARRVRHVRRALLPRLPLRPLPEPRRPRAGAGAPAGAAARRARR